MTKATAPRPIRESHLRDELPPSNTAPDVHPDVLAIARKFNSALDRAAFAMRRYTDRGTEASGEIADRMWDRVRAAEKRLVEVMRRCGVSAFVCDGRIVAQPEGRPTDGLPDSLRLTVLDLAEVDGLMKGGDRC